jgi:hypothetical protein
LRYHDLADPKTMKTEPNQAPEPTPTTVTPPARQGQLSFGVGKAVFPRPETGVLR